MVRTSEHPERANVAGNRIRRERVPAEQSVVSLTVEMRGPFASMPAARCDPEVTGSLRDHDTMIRGDLIRTV
jgi:hypothetical protein